QRGPLCPIPRGNPVDGLASRVGEVAADDQLSVVDREGLHGAVYPGTFRTMQGLPLLPVPARDAVDNDAAGLAEQAAAIPLPVVLRQRGHPTAYTDPGTERSTQRGPV